MKRKSILWLLIALLLTLSLVLVACGGDDEEAVEEAVEEVMEEVEEVVEEVEEVVEEVVEEMAEPITVDVWFHSGKGEERDVLDGQVTDFNTMQDKIFINAIQLPEGSYNDQVSAGALAGDLPCLLDFDGPYLYNYAWSGYLRPLDDLIAADVKADFLPSIINQGTYDGKLYSLGTFDSGLAIWANKAYLEAAGVRIPTSIADAWDLDEFNAVLAAVQALPEVEYALDVKMNYGTGEWFPYGFSPILQSFGGDLIDRSDYQSADGVLNSAASVAAHEWFQSLFTDGYAIAEPPGDDDFHTNKIAAMAWVGHWMWGPHSEGLGDDLILLPMPDFGSGAKTGMGSWNWGLTNSCENPEEAFEFLSYLVEPEQILRMTDANGAVPARKSAIAMSDLFGEGGPLNVFIQQLVGGVALERPVTPAYPVISSAYAEVIQNIVAGGDVTEELDKAVAIIDQDIEDNAGYPTN